MSIGLEGSSIILYDDAGTDKIMLGCCCGPVCQVRIISDSPKVYESNYLLGGPGNYLIDMPTGVAYGSGSNTYCSIGGGGVPSPGNEGKLHVTVDTYNNLEVTFTGSVQIICEEGVTPVVSDLDKFREDNCNATINLVGDTATWSVVFVASVGGVVEFYFEFSI